MKPSDEAVRRQRLDDAVVARRRATVLLTAAEAAAVYDRMARELAERVADADPVVLAVMNGGAFTAVELARRFEFPCEFAYVHATRYGDALRGGELRWRVEPARELAGRTVVLVDDILDEGLTLAGLVAALEQRGVARLVKAVFAVKRLARPVDRPRVDVAGTQVDDVYVFGCGMDYRGYWRGAPELLALAAEDAGAAAESPVSGEVESAL